MVERARTKSTHGAEFLNCTRRPVYVTVCPKCGYDTMLSGRPEMVREAEALRELVASWHSLTPSVRAAIIDLIR
jgi:DNA-directed RNA polymerase subunit RPC12/RpoP